MSEIKHKTILSGFGPCSCFSQINTKWTQRTEEHMNLQDTDCVLLGMWDDVENLAVSWVMDHKVATRNMSSFSGVTSAIVYGFLYG